MPVVDERPLEKLNRNPGEYGEIFLDPEQRDRYARSGFRAENVLESGEDYSSQGRYGNEVPEDVQDDLDALAEMGVVEPIFEELEQKPESTLWKLNLEKAYRHFVGDPEEVTVSHHDNKVRVDGRYVSPEQTVASRDVAEQMAETNRLPGGLAPPSGTTGVDIPISK